MGRGTSLLDAFSAANNVLLGAVQGIAELISRPGLINVDFADVRAVMKEMGTAMMGTGVASGEDRAQEAAEMAINSPLLEDIDLSGARGVLINVTAGMDMSIEELDTVGNTVKAFASDNATVIVGTVIDTEMSDELRVTVVATGIGAERKPDISLVNNTNQTTAKREPQPAYRSNDIDRGGAAPRYEEQEELQPEAKAEPKRQPAAKAKQDKELDYLDIPAFLRKQVD